MEIKFLGTGASEGVPVIGCKCKHCSIALNDSKSTRLRSSILLANNDEFLLIDPGVDTRQQLLKYRINRIDVIVVTHEHYDHAYGLKEFKYWNNSEKDNPNVTLCAPQSLLREILFLAESAIQSGKLTLKPITPYVFTTIGAFKIKPIRIAHTKHSFGYVIEAGSTRFVYLSDIAEVNRTIIDKYTHHLSKSDYFVVNTPFFVGQKGRHIGVLEAIELGKRFESRHTILNHFNHHNKSYSDLVLSVNNTAIISFDGMVVRK